MGKRIDVTVEKDADGYLVETVPGLKGEHTQAKSLDELIEHIREAVSLYLDGELVTIESDDDRASEAESSFLETTLDEVAGCFVYDGVPKRVEDFDAAIDQAMQNGSL
ncbi:MAG: hypothetical protein AAFO06_02615 [Cyanobacteria bacterium J06597_16]